MPRLTLECQAILFDVDGVLVDSRAIVERAWARWAARTGIDPHGIAEAAHGRRSIETVRALAPHLDADAEVAWLESDEIQDIAGLVALPGAEAALRAVPEARRAIVTSGRHALAETRLRASGLPLPTIVVAAEDVRSGKPDPAGYLLAARRLGHSATDCIVMEDAPAGIAAGRSAGATVIALPTTFPPSALGEANVIVESLAQVRITALPECLRVEIEAVGPLPGPAETR